MASSHEEGGAEQKVVGEKVPLTTATVEKGAKLLQSLTPVKQFQQHVCTWAMYSHDMNRKIETHHYAARLNEDLLQCAVFDSDQDDARLIGVEYIISDRLFLALPEEEQKLWHSHLYEIEQGLWVNPGVPEVMQKMELKKLAKTYGKFWCTWQVDRGDKIPMGPPALMMSPQEVPPGQIPEEMVHNRDAKYNITSMQLAQNRADIAGSEVMHTMADYWKKTGKGFVVGYKEVDIALGAGSPLKNLS
ncbi:hypothetical protein GOP47_0019386 [Adiantum capillus-veneris]|uniref:Uncharacterized protein n=1 Tax=Adiantum capillus-veneris TaxID=13818 RepID=A0A9D4Z9K4_ADICA|nr:hypothetical protein GOP47_0019386 [Adiantum capillus-veneris]